jgi:FtsH-binding integral membrane protein
MAADSKRGIGTVLVVLGLANVVVSLIFLMVGNIPIGATFLGSGVVFFTIGVSAARKALPSEESPPTNEH